MTEATYSAPPEMLEEAIRLIADRSGRMTPQRRAIIEAAFCQEHPYTAEELYEQARDRNPGVSRATVYRTLPLLLETHFLRKIVLDYEPARYEPNPHSRSHHSFIWCTDCDQMFPFDDHCLGLREAPLIRSLGFVARDVQLRVDATCDELHRTGVCRRGNKGKRHSATVAR